MPRTVVSAVAWFVRGGGEDGVASWLQQLRRVRQRLAGRAAGGERREQRGWRRAPRPTASACRIASASALEGPRA